MACGIGLYRKGWREGGVDWVTSFYSRTGVLEHQPIVCCISILRGVHSMTISEYLFAIFTGIDSEVKKKKANT